jgi:uncharacterized protein YjbJ (UPF0337 family)
MTHKNIDKAKGRVKEAAGALTGSGPLKDEGRVDQAMGSAKNAADKVRDTVTEAADQAKSSAKNAADKVGETVTEGVDRVTGRK